MPGNCTSWVRRYNSEMDAASKSLDRLLGIGLLASGSAKQEMIDELVSALSGLYPHAPAYEMWAKAREIIRKYEPILADIITESELAAWISSQAFIASSHSVSGGSQGGIVSDQWRVPYGNWVIRHPALDKAIEFIESAGVVSRFEYDSMSREARQRSFTTAAASSDAALNAIRDMVVAAVRDGDSLDTFRKNLKNMSGASGVSNWSQEAIYRNSVLKAFSDGQESIVRRHGLADILPYARYDAIHDGRVRDDHKLLETLGLSGTNIYRADDPVWRYITPPWDFSCRCSKRYMTVKQAAKEGVWEAVQWLNSGVPPEEPEYRYSAVSEEITIPPASGYTPVAVYV